MPALIDWKAPEVELTLNLLLKDRSTGKNIIFATDAYDGIDFTTPITKKLLLDGAVDIRPRVEKTIEEQSLRTRKRAEVFTPSWLCNKMNNHCDTEWFGRVDVFNMEQEQQWQRAKEKISFPEGKSWQDYVRSTRLEITCGEAPYLVSRYDTVTGEKISVEDRIGILDRKLRIVSENTENRKTWTRWTYRAFESVYGYEYQGDNLLIARINLLETYCDYVRHQWHDEPTTAELKRIATIISWNLWQMDGIHGIVPTPAMARMQEESVPHQMNMFDLFGMADGPDKKEPMDETEVVDCQIYDWQEDKVVTYKSIRESEK